MTKLDIDKIKRNAVKVKEITCLVAIEDDDDLTKATISYRTKDEKLIILDEVFYRKYNEKEKQIIDELIKPIEEEEKMSNYTIWKCENEDELLIEIFNERDLPDIQKEFLEKGYIIIRIDYAFDNVVMKVVKKDE